MAINGQSGPNPVVAAPIRRGEHLVSIPTGIAVLVMALIGAAMFVAFSNIFDDASSRTADTVQGITDGG